MPVNRRGLDGTFLPEITNKGHPCNSLKGRPTPTRYLFIAVLSTLVSTTVHATVYAVGCGGYASFYDALNGAISDPYGPNLVKVSNNKSYILAQDDIVDPASDITIEGGYASCSDAEPVAGQYTTLTNNNPPATTRLRYLSNALSNPRHTITLRHLILTGGSIPGDASGGGAVYAQGNIQLTLDDVQINNNIASNGGGISLANLSTDPSKQTVLQITGNTKMSNNQATGTTNSNGNGGGIYAIGNTRIVFINGQVVTNTARRAGGGIAIRTNLASLSFQLTTGDEIYVDGNGAGRGTFYSTEGYGGAIFSEDANIDTTFGGIRNAYQVYLLANSANYGGAIYVLGDPSPSGAFTFISLRNALIGNNEAYGKGGAMYSSNAVDWNIDHQAAGKCAFFSTQPCSLILNNQADNTGTSGSPGGGVIYLTSEAGSQRGIARIKRTLINGNKDPNGSVAVGMADNDNEFLIQRSIFINNSAPLGNNSVILSSNGPTRAYYSDFPGNAVSRLFHFTGDTLDVQGSIFADPATPIWYHASGSTMMANDFLLSNTATDIPTSVQVGDALLGADDMPEYRYPVVDNCDNYGDAPRDIPGIDNRYGINDLGAVEQTDMIFYGGFGNRPTD